MRAGWQQGARSRMGDHGAWRWNRGGVVLGVRPRRTLMAGCNTVTVFRRGKRGDAGKKFSKNSLTGPMSRIKRRTVLSRIVFSRSQTKFRRFQPTVGDPGQQPSAVQGPGASAIDAVCMGNLARCVCGRSSELTAVGRGKLPPASRTPDRAPRTFTRRTVP